MRKTKRKKNYLAKSKRKGRGIGASKISIRRTRAPARPLVRLLTMERVSERLNDDKVAEAEERAQKVIAAAERAIATAERVISEARVVMVAHAVWEAWLESDEAANIGYAAAMESYLDTRSRAIGAIKRESKAMFEAYQSMKAARARGAEMVIVELAMEAEAMAAAARSAVGAACTTLASMVKTLTTEDYKELLRKNKIE